MESNSFLRPAPEHVCAFDGESDWCRVCFNHAMNPNNYVATTAPTSFKVFAGLAMLAVIAWCLHLGVALSG